MDSAGTTYTDAHRAFLQSFLAHSTHTLETAAPILASIYTTLSSSSTTSEDQSCQDQHPQYPPSSITEQNLKSHITSINAALSPFDLEIRTSRSQTGPRETIYALVNTTSDPISQLATLHTADEIAYIKRVLDYMFEVNNSTNYEILGLSGQQALGLNRVRGSGGSGGGQRRSLNLNDSVSGAEESQNGTSSAKDLTTFEAETLLGSLVDEGWFEKSPRDFYTLSPRALMELRGWLVETYNEYDDTDFNSTTNGNNILIERIKFCQACKEIVTKGQRCPTRTCNSRIHDNCAEAFFRSRRNQLNCPVCGQDWSEPDFVGERVALRRDQRGGQQRRKGGELRGSLNGRQSGGSIVRPDEDQDS